MNAPGQPGGAGNLGNLGLNQDLTSRMISNYHVDLAQEVIVTTEDKLKNYLTDYERDIQYRRDWVTPLGIGLSVAMVFPTATFSNNAFGVNKNTWEAIFVILLVLSAAWFVVTAIRAFYTVVKKPVTTEAVIKVIKDNALGQGTPSPSPGTSPAPAPTTPPANPISGPTP